MASFDPDAYIQGESGATPGAFDPDSYVAEHSMTGSSDASDDSLVGRAGQGLLRGIGYLGNKVDAYTGAPVRAAIGAAQTAPDIAQIPAASAKAFGRQWGEDPMLAPSGKQIAARAGVGTESVLSPEAQAAVANVLKHSYLGYMADKAFPGSVENLAGASPAGIAGAGIDMASNPVNYLPVEKVVAGAVRGASDLMGTPAGWLTGKLAGKAESLAEKSTGATGKQMLDTFKPGTGRALLDQRVVRFGNDPAAIAQNAQDVMDAAEASKQGLIQGPLQGAAVDRRAILGSLRGKIAALQGDESQVGLVKALEQKAADIEAQIRETPPPAPIDQPVPDQQVQEALPSLRRPTLGRDPETGRIVPKTTPPTLDNIPARAFPVQGTQPGLGLPEARAPSSEIPLAQSEGMRRNFDKKAKWTSNSDADVLEANRIVAGIYRDAGENAASSVSPELGAQFKADKTTQATLIPAQEAAAKRAAQLAQSPHGGLLDLAAAGGGGTIGALLGGAEGAGFGTALGLAAKNLRPRYASMGAVSTDRLAQAVARAPGAFAEYAAPLATAAQRGPAVLSAMHNALMQTDPGYPAQLERVLGKSAPSASRAPATPVAPPARGEAAWAQSGLQNLGVSDPGLSQRLLSDPKARALLIQASDLAPGSKAMKAVQSQLRKGWNLP